MTPETSSRCRSRVRTGAALALAGFALAVAPAAAHGATTVGSDLTGIPFGADACGSSDACTAAMTAIPGRQVSSPLNGVVVRWRIRVDNSEDGAARLVVLRPAGGGTYTRVNGSATEAIPNSGDRVVTLQTRQRIRAGDLIALDLDDGNGNFQVRTSAVPGTGFIRWQPPLAGGATSTPDLTDSDGGELLLNADVEPDCDGDGLGDETQDPRLSGVGCFPNARCFGRRATIVGSAARDVLVGTRRRDVIVGLAGNDVIRGRGGNDLICGSVGADRLVGAAGNDRISGQVGRDRLLGGNGRDRLLGGNGGDRLFGGAARDLLLGGRGPDLLVGGPAFDRLVPGPGRDRLRQ